MPKKYEVHTLGCKANLYDSQLLEESFRERGLEPTQGNGDTPDVCVVNSCSVTDEADKQSRKLAQRLKRKYPKSKVVFTGCSAEIDPKTFAAVDEIDLVVSNREKFDLLRAGSFEATESDKTLGDARGYSAFESKHPMDREWPAPASVFHSPGKLPQHSSSHRTRSFLKIQEGCNSFCTFCIIPYGRGPSRSLPPEHVLEQVQELESRGVREVVFTGTNLGDYGSEWGTRIVELERLLLFVLKNTTDIRLRISSLDPVEISPRIREINAAHPRFCSHFHVSLQSPHSKILRGMKRRYGFEEVRACLQDIERLSDPESPTFVGMDVIAGFPGETKEIFEETVQMLTELPWTRLHVFPYSERKSTPATRIPHVVPMGERKERSRRLIELSNERLRSHYQALRNADGIERTYEDVLVEEGRVRGPDQTREWLSGYSQNYLRFLIKDTGRLEPGRVQPLTVGGVASDQNSGDVFFIGNSP